MEVEGRPMRVRTILFALAILATAAVLAAQQAPKVAAPRDPERIDAPGYQKLLQQYRGKPLLVTFWATWCEPCRDEYPMLNDLAKQYAPQGLKVVGVNLDDDGDLILMRRFLARYKPIFPNYRKTAGAEEEFRNTVQPGWTGGRGSVGGRHAREVRGGNPLTARRRLQLEKTDRIRESKLLAKMIRGLKIHALKAGEEL
jgi:thiol-disulfide isomerase/thioredoxin